MEQSHSPEKKLPGSNFLLRAVEKRLVRLRHLQIDRLTPGFPVEGTSYGKLRPTVVEVIKNTDGMKVSLKREETRGVPGYDLSIEVLRDYYGGISGIRAKAVESKGGEIPSTRMYDSFSSEPDSFSLGEVVGGLRQAHHHFNPSAPELDA